MPAGDDAEHPLTRIIWERKAQKIVVPFTEKALGGFAVDIIHICRLPVGCRVLDAAVSVEVAGVRVGGTALTGLLSAESQLPQLVSAFSGIVVAYNPFDGFFSDRKEIPFVHDVTLAFISTAGGAQLTAASGYVMMEVARADNTPDDRA